MQVADGRFKIKNAEGGVKTYLMSKLLYQMQWIFNLAFWSEIPVHCTYAAMSYTKSHRMLEASPVEQTFRDTVNIHSLRREF